MVVASGTWNNIRSMITGRYAIVPESRRRAHDALAHRRGWLQAGAGLGRRRWSSAPATRSPPAPRASASWQSAEGLTRRAQRLVVDRKALAREFILADISADFRPNGSIDPTDADYVRT